ncbi:MAG: dTMP kinase [Nitrososphaeraceae archaeon]|jgi:dTMP kinase
MNLSLSGSKNLRKVHFYGHAIPYLEGIEIKGKFIVLEGPDNSGRSTQIELLSNKLEADGHAVMNAGLRRSELMGEGIAEAKKTYVLGKRTMSLFYAADFADQLENKIIPALRAGYIVLSDRYIYTLMARDAVRGISKSWSHNLYGFALKPDLLFYLDVDPNELAHRVFKKNSSLDYYESGVDLGLSENMLESFIIYQKLIANEFKRMERKYSIIPIDGNRGILDINIDFQNRIDEYLSSN